MLVKIDSRALDQIDPGEEMEVDEGRLVLVNGHDDVMCRECSGVVRIEIEEDSVWLACKCNEWIAGIDEAEDAAVLVVAS